MTYIEAFKESMRRAGLNDEQIATIIDEPKTCDNREIPSGYEEMFIEHAIEEFKAFVAQRMSRN